jgi:hypothetical protein
VIVQIEKNGRVYLVIITAAIIGEEGGYGDGNGNGNGRLWKVMEGHGRNDKMKMNVK